MSIIYDLKMQIAALQTRIAAIQAQCCHPPSAVTSVPQGSTDGDGRDKYWYHKTCGLCEHVWTEPQ